jgi:hypothetical protein
MHWEETLIHKFLLFFYINLREKLSKISKRRRKWNQWKFTHSHRDKIIIIKKIIMKIIIIMLESFKEPQRSWWWVLILLSFFSFLIHTFTQSPKRTESSCLIDKIKLQNGTNHKLHTEINEAVKFKTKTINIKNLFL